MLSPTDCKRLTLGASLLDKAKLLPDARFSWHLTRAIHSTHGSTLFHRYLQLMTKDTPASFQPLNSFVMLAMMQFPNHRHTAEAGRYIIHEMEPLPSPPQLANP